MSILEYFFMLLASTPAMLFWIAVLIFGIVKLKRGGGRAERFLIAGGSVRLIGNLFGVTNIYFVSWFFQRDYSTNYIITISTGYGVLYSVIRMVGIICLIYAFWLKFNEWKTPEKSSMLLERG